MSKLITSAAIRGAHKIVTRVENKYKEVLEKYGPDQAIELPDTDGRSVRLGSLWEAGPAVLVFLRHYG